MAAKKKASGRRYGPAAGKSVKSAMHRRKKGTLKRGKSGHGGTVTSRKQAIAIGLSEAREKGAKVPAKRASGKKTSTKRASTSGGTKRAASKSRPTAKRSTAKRSTAKRSTTKRATTKRSTAKRSS